VKYRRAAILDWEVSVLAVGVPPAATDRSFVGLLREAVDAGVNLVDLGWFPGMAEHGPWTDLVREALADGYRERVRVAVNVPPTLAVSRAECSAFLGQLAAALDLGRFDLCIVGGVDRVVWGRLREAGFSSWAGSLVEEGLASALGFYLCDDLQVLRQVLAAFDGWAVCKTRYGFFDHLRSRPGSTGVRFAAEQGLLVVVAEPTRGALAWLEGAKTAAVVPQALLEALGVDAGRGDLGAWALRWAWDDPAVSTVVVDLLPGSDWKGYLGLADTTTPRSLSIKELTSLNHLRDYLTSARPAACPACHTCMPCPEGIDIPRVLDLANDVAVYGAVENSRASYLMEGHRATECTACGECEADCPRGIPIIERLTQAAGLLDGTR